MSERARIAPVAESDRIRSLDATRGVALLGIFLVNIGTFAAPFGEFVLPSPPPGSTRADWICWFAGKIFCEGRFYPLFSMLFGMGLLIQYRRARAAGRGFTAPTLRRLAVMIAIGACHALLLWYGDILFMYGTIGLSMLLLVRLRPGTQLILGGSFLALVVALAFAGGVLMYWMESQKPQRDSVPAAVAEVAPTDPATAESPNGHDADVADGTDAAPRGDVDAAPRNETGAEPRSEAGAGPSSAGSPFARAMDLMRRPGFQGPGDPRWMALETEAFRDGPYTQAILFRLIIWGWFLMFALFGFGWHILAMFCVGAALMQLDIFSPKRRRWHLCFVATAALVAVPLSFGAAMAQVSAGPWFMFAVSAPVAYLLGPVISLGYLGAVTLAVNAGALRPLTALLSAAGRMAFTNYLMQTLIATAVFHHWGLGLFGTFTRGERVLFVAAVYAGQLAFSVLWLRWFSMGPLEWLWRAATYLRFTPILRRGNSDDQ